MRSVIMKNLMDIVKRNGQYDEVKLEEIQYGLESIYILITKLFVIILLAILLGIWKQVLLFLLIYNIIRTTSFGLHATKSWICLVSSSIIFIGVPLLCEYIIFPIWLKVIAGIILLFLFYKNAPADTYKRPIVSPKRRMVYKYISVIICIIFIFASILIQDHFLANCFLMALIVQSCMISPLVYRIFHLPYNNYKTYLQEAI